MLQLQQTTGFGIQTQQKFRIGLHLRLQKQRRQFTPVLQRQKQPIGPVFPGLEHRRNKPIAIPIWHTCRRQFRQKLQDPIGLLLEQPVEKLVAGGHGPWGAAPWCQPLTSPSSAASRH
jgi:hypothetical protein